MTVIKGPTDAKWDEAEAEALDLLVRHMRTDDPGLEKRVPSARTVLGAAIRRMATIGHREALRFQIASRLAETPEELAEYVRLTQPSIPQLGDAKHGTARHGLAGQGKAD